VMYESDEATVLIDPLLPADEVGWEPLERRIISREQPVSILLTAPWHRRSAATLSERYSCRIWADAAAAPHLPFKTESGPLRGGIEVFRHGVGSDPQVAFFLREVGALVVAEFFMGTGSALLLCPPPNFDPAQRALLRTSLRQLLDLPFAHVLVAHGEPVLGTGREAVEAALTG
jgi:hypothetical protein